MSNILLFRWCLHFEKALSLNVNELNWMYLRQNLGQYEKSLMSGVMWMWGLMMSVRTHDISALMKVLALYIITAILTWWWRSTLHTTEITEAAQTQKERRYVIIFCANWTKASDLNFSTGSGQAAARVCTAAVNQSARSKTRWVACVYSATLWVSTSGKLDIMKIQIQLNTGLIMCSCVIVIVSVALW